MAYKRVLAKALRNTEGIGTPTSKTVTPQDKSRTTTPYSPGTGTPYSPNSKAAKAKRQETGETKVGTNKENKSARSSRDKHKRESDNKTKDASESKKPKLDKVSTANGAPSKSNSMSDLSSSENMVIITQLKEELEALKKIVIIKDQQILERDKKLTEVKADSFESENLIRRRLTNMQKLHQEQIDSLQIKNRDLMKQVAVLQKKVGKKGVAAIAAAASDL